MANATFKSTAQTLPHTHIHVQGVGKTHTNKNPKQFLLWIIARAKQANYVMTTVNKIILNKYYNIPEADSIAAMQTQLITD